MNITSPGIYREFDEASYFRDPCPEPSLSQSIGKIAVEQSGMHAAVQHPRMTTAEAEPEDYKKPKAIGNAAHKLMLGRGRDVAIIKADDFRTKAAKEARDDATAAGRLPILEAHFAEAELIVRTGKAYLAKHEDRDAFTNGSGEVVIAWEEDGLWFRSLIDWLSDDLRTVDDYKTTAMSVAPHVLGFRAEAGGWHVQAAFIERGLDILDPAGAGRRRFRFIPQEQDAPYALVSMHMDEHWLTMGRKVVDAAVTRWRAVLRGGWNGYPLKGITPEYPGFKENKWLGRELDGEFESPNDTKLIMAG